MANHTENFWTLLLNTTRDTLRKRKSNQAIFNESGKTKKSEKLGKSGQVGTF